ncbi:MAG TPA: TIGR01777 family oxidoreductase [Isosphaeraceae bacterium]|nr:TIGR01777 family oxidoreductase [Isosphaeraceae bacterium]
MRVFITGGTGLIGRHLALKLGERGDQPVILSRRPDQVRREPAMRPFRFVQGDPSARGSWESELDGCDAVVNLVGHNIFADRWDAEVKRKIRDSRVYSTQNVIAALGQARNRPKVLVQASAIGYYGIHGDEALTEESPSGSDFMAVVSREWEEASRPAESLGVRVARIRTGVVLARGEGALGLMTPIFRWLPLGAAPVGNGGGLLKPATGQQWMSWIHIDDIVGLFLLALDRAEASGPINGTAPHPVRNAEFSKALARTLWRPYVPFGPPDALLEVMLGEVAQVVTKGQRVMPTRAQALGYTFKYPELRGALRDLFAKPRAAPRSEPVAVKGAQAHH